MAVSAYRLHDLILADYFEAAVPSVGMKLPSTGDLAERYGASCPTVTKALRMLAGEGWVTARRGSGVYVAARPNRGSRYRPQPDRRIGCVVQGLDRFLTHRVFEGVEKVARRNGCIVEVAATEWSVEEERRQIAAMRTRGVQGVVLCPTAYRSEAPDYLATEFTDYPVVVVDLYQAAMKRPHLIFDNVQAGREMTRYLLRQGRREIAFLKFPDGVPHRSVDDRVLGYRRALEEAGEVVVPERIVSFSGAGHWTRDYHSALERVLALKPRPTAIITPHDPYAEAGIAWLRRKGVNVPGDIIVAGFDNLQHEPWVERFPTTNPDFTAMGERAAETLLERIRTRDMEATGLILPCPLVLPSPLVLSEQSGFIVDRTLEFAAKTAV